MFYGKFKCTNEIFRQLLKQTEKYKDDLCFLDPDKKEDYYYVLYEAFEDRNDDEKFIQDILCAGINLEPSTPKEIEDICSPFSDKLFGYIMTGNKNLLPVSFS